MKKSQKQSATNTDKYEFLYLPGYDPYRDAGDRYYYDPTAGERAVDFFIKELTLTKGKWKGQPFIPFLWAQDVIRAVFGWLDRETGLRRYSEVFIYVPRKNAKSELVAGIAVAVLYLDDEPENEIYIGASNKEQAKTLYSMAENMMRQNLDLWKDIKPKETTSELIASWDKSKIQAISSDALSAHGYSPGLSIIDELHAQKNRKLIEALDTGSGARQQPLTIYISTADEDKPSVCNDELKQAMAVRDGKVVNPNYLPVLFMADKEDDWTSEETWKKANPSYPETPNREYLMKKLLAAKTSKAKEMSFKRLFLNMRTASGETWLNMDAWRLGNEDFNEDEMIGADCYFGIDLASKSDIATIQGFFPEFGRLISRFYVPKKAVEKDETGHYQEWVDAGYMVIAGEFMIDYDYIKRDYLELRKKFNAKETAIDSWNASQFIIDLETKEGIEVTEFRQGTLSFNEPSKEFEVMVDAGTLKHNSPVLDWMASNVSIKEDANENIRPVKPGKTSPLKIDGIVAAIMAIGVWMRDRNEDTESVYEEHGLRTV